MGRVFISHLLRYSGEGPVNENMKRPAFYMPASSIEKWSIPGNQELYD
jgi:hypothetical protein